MQRGIIIYHFRPRASKFHAPPLGGLACLAWLHGNQRLKQPGTCRLPSPLTSSPRTYFALHRPASPPVLHLLHASPSLATSSIKPFVRRPPISRSPHERCPFILTLQHHRPGSKTQLAPVARRTFSLVPRPRAPYDTEHDCADRNPLPCLSLAPLSATLSRACDSPRAQERRERESRRGSGIVFGKDPRALLP